MPRKRKENDDTEARKKRVRSFRNRERRQRRADTPADTSDLTWLISTGVKLAAMKVLNATRSQSWPFWLSIGVDGRAPVSDFYPCKHHVRGNRLWYAFMFREHRDEQVARWPDARKELTPDQ